MYGMPCSVVHAVKDTPEDVDCRHSLLASSMHIPSLAVVLCILLASLVQASSMQIRPPLHDALESAVVSNVWGTVFQPGFCQTFPGYLDGNAVAKGFYDQCRAQGLSLPRSQASLAAALRSLDLSCLQCYWVDKCMREGSCDVLGPEFAQQCALARLARDGHATWHGSL